MVGLGSIGARHARLARTLLPDAEITVLRHRACGDLAGTGIDRCVTSLDAALATQPEAAVIASPATHHLATALPLARAGVHLLVEKPLATDSAAARALPDAARAAGAVLLTGYNLRFLPSLRRLRAEVVAGRVGRVLSVRAEIGQYLPGWRPGADYRESVSAQARLGGGVLLELSHELDYLRWLFGDVAWVSAVERRQGALEIDVADTALLTLGFAGGEGGPGVVASLGMDFLRHDTTRRCTVIGDAGTLRWDALAGTVELYAAGGAGWTTLATDAPARDETYLAEWRHFLACIAGGERPAITGEDGLAVLRIIEAAQRSSAAGAVVPLSPESMPA